MARICVGLLTETIAGSASTTAIDGGSTGSQGHQRGMFWDIQATSHLEERIIWHNGRTGGYSASVVLLPDTSRALITLANVSRSTDLEQATARLLQA